MSSKADGGEPGPAHEEHARPARASAWAPTLLLAALVVVPGASFGVFSGLPLSTTVELVALLLVAPLLASRALREGIAGRLASRGRLVTRLVLVLMALAVVAKVLLFVDGSREGFLACYRATQAEGPSGCERSYENPLFRSDATRVDRVIDFGRVGRDDDFPTTALVEGVVQNTNWNLSFLNARRFNFRGPEGPDFEKRAWLRFTARWAGTVATSAPRTLTVRYVGEGDVRLGARSATLRPSYASVGTARLDVPAGRHLVRVSYRFDTPVPPPPVSLEAVPYATLRIRYADGEPFSAVRAGGLPRAASGVVDGLTAVALLGALAHLALALVPLAGALVPAAVAAVLAGLLPGEVARQLVLALVVLGLVVALWTRYERARAAVVGLGAYASIALVEVVRARGSYGDLTTVLYRGAGQDFLTYEGDARRILETGSLQGGEDVFVYSAGFRYLVFLAHVVFGDRDVFIGIAGLVVLTLSVFWLGSQLLDRRVARPRTRADRRRHARRSSRPSLAHLHQRLTPDAARRAAALVALAGLLVLVETAGVQMVRVLMSEYPTWIFLLLASGLLLGAPSLRRAVVGAGLLGLALVVRADQAGAVALLLAVVLVAQVRRLEPGRRMRAAAAVGLTTGAIALLPAAHNLHYGDELAFVAKTPSHPVNFPLPPGDLLRVFSDQAVRATLGDQLAGVLVTNTDDIGLVGSKPAFLAGIRLLQLLWLGCLVWALVRWRALTLAGRLTLFLPLAFLLPHVFVQVYVYYPRHVIAGYRAMGVSAAFVLSTAGRRAVYRAAAEGQIGTKNVLGGAELR